MRRKKIVFVCMALMIFVAGILAGCASDSGREIMEDDGKLHVICTTFPLYDWSGQIAGKENDNIELELLLSDGTDMHSYQATAMDVAKISSCDVLICIGGESEKWVDEVIADAVNKDMKVIRMFDVLGEDIREEEMVLGMQEEKHEDEHGEHDETEYDEHVWLSLKNAKKLCGEIKNTLCEADSGNADIYEVNYRDYAAELDTLDQKFLEMTDTSERKTILFGDRFPFRYLTEDYQINYYAAFPGCSAETEASFETVAFLSQKMDEENLPVILVIENSDDKIARTILSNTQKKDREILVMNSMQSVSKKEMDAGASYLSIMESNYEVLKKALN